MTNTDHQPTVSLLVDHYAADWAELWWVRVDGEATATSHSVTVATGHALLREKYPQYESVGPAPQLIVIRPIRVASWSAG